MFYHNITMHKNILNLIIKKSFYFLKMLNLSATNLLFINVISSIFVGFIPYFLGVSKAYLILLSLFLLIRIALVTVANHLAKNFSQNTIYFTVLKDISLQISDVSILIAFLAINEYSVASLFFFWIFAGISDSAVIIGKSITGKSVEVGPIGFYERSYILSILSLFLAFHIINNYLFNLCIILLAVLCLFTVVNRINYIFELCEE